MSDTLELWLQTNTDISISRAETYARALACDNIANATRLAKHLIKTPNFLGMYNKCYSFWIYSDL